MPKFAQIETANHGEFFAKCATEDVAGRNSFDKTFGEDYIRIIHFSWHAVSSIDSNTSIIVSLTVPAHAPAVVSAFQVLNSRDNITKMILKNVDRVSSNVGNNRGVISSVFTGEDGTLISANESSGTDDKDTSKLDLVIEFTKLTFENNVTHTTGIIKTTNAGL